MTVMGNIVLFGKSTETIWLTFDHPTDCLVPGQIMTPGQTLISSISAIDWREGMLALDVKGSGLFAYIESNPCQLYASRLYLVISFPFPELNFYLTCNASGEMFFKFLDSRFVIWG